MLAEELMQAGHSAVALHGAMPQSVRNRRLQNLRDGRIRILVATDVAARGLDVPTISHVFNFGLPMKAEDYVHRIGRTGRAGRSGTAVTIAEYRERSKIRAIEQYTRQPMSASVIPGLEPSPPKPSSKPAGRKPGRAGGGGWGRKEGGRGPGASAGPGRRPAPAGGPRPFRPLIPRPRQQHRIRAWAVRPARTPEGRLCRRPFSWLFAHPISDRPAPAHPLGPDRQGWWGSPRDLPKLHFAARPAGCAWGDFRGAEQRSAVAPVRG